MSQIMKDANPPKNTLIGPGERLYLDIMKNCLTRAIFAERYAALRRPAVVGKRAMLWWAIYPYLNRILHSQNLELVRQVHIDPAQHIEGGHWPPEAETMLGLKRLDNI